MAEKGNLQVVVLSVSDLYCKQNKKPEIIVQVGVRNHQTKLTETKFKSQKAKKGANVEWGDIRVRLDNIDFRDSLVLQFFNYKIIKDEDIGETIIPLNEFQSGDIHKRFPIAKANPDFSPVVELHVKLLSDTLQASQASNPTLDKSLPQQPQPQPQQQQQQHTQQQPQNQQNGQQTSQPQLAPQQHFQYPPHSPQVPNQQQNPQVYQQQTLAPPSPAQPLLIPPNNQYPPQLGIAYSPAHSPMRPNYSPQYPPTHPIPQQYQYVQNPYQPQQQYAPQYQYNVYQQGSNQLLQSQMPQVQMQQPQYYQYTVNQSPAQIIFQNAQGMPNSAPHTPTLHQPSNPALDLSNSAALQGYNIDYREIVFQNKIGSGAFGEVWKGEWAGTSVAIKKIAAETIKEKDLQEFSSEILLMSKLRHPNIVQFLGACLHPEFFCLLTEYMDKGSLFHVLQKEPNMPISLRIQIATDIAKGMVYLHTRNPPIVHRDIKSLNILIAKDWKATITDFGLTKIKDKAMLTTRCGSPAWSAPEVLRGEPYTEKVDVFGFGIVLWEIISGQPPYKGMEPVQLIQLIAYKQPSLRPPLPPCQYPQIIDLMQRCWHDDPSARPDFQYALDALRRIEVH